MGKNNYAENLYGKKNSMKKMSFFVLFSLVDLEFKAFDKERLFLLEENHLYQDIFNRKPLFSSNYILANKASQLIPLVGYKLHTGLARSLFQIHFFSILLQRQFSYFENMDILSYFKFMKLFKKMLKPFFLDYGDMPFYMIISHLVKQ